MDSFWCYSSNSSRSPQEILESQLKLSGKLYNDLQALVQQFNIPPHPCFHEAGYQETETPYFSAISHKFDLFSFKILSCALSSCPTRLVKFNNCELSEEHIDLLLPSLNSDHFSWLQIDWNPLPDTKFSELLREGSKLQLLSLRVSNLGDEAFRLICENLKNNRYLKTLDVYGNNISNLSPFIEVLDINRVFSNLNISKNSITDESLSPLIGAFGKLEFPDDKVEEYRKKEKEIAKIKAQKNRGKAVEVEPLADELIQDEESKQYFLLKNKVFKQINLSFNSLNSCDNLKTMLNHCLASFKVVISYTNLPQEIIDSLMKTHQNFIVV